MEVNRCFCIVAVLLLTTSEIFAANESCEFESAVKEIAKHPNGSISYDTFCVTISSGQDKIACRIKNVPSVGFLVCKMPVYTEEEDIPCKEIIDTEMKNILKLQSEYNLKTVEVYNKIIPNVKCGNQSDVTCSGFLECWIDKKEGKFKQIRDHIVEGKINDLVKDVKAITTSQGLSTTIADIQKIEAFMKPTSPNATYKQICDLQGFFLITGGFLVADTPEINENIGLNDRCFDGDPTTQQVLDGLDKIVKGLRNGGALGIQASGQIIPVLLFLHHAFLLLL